MGALSDTLAPPPAPLYEQIRENLQQQIRAGAFRHYERIPSEKELMLHFGVSRITVRQALSDLAREGLIFKIPGKGSYVSKPKPTQELTQLKGFGEAMAQQGYVTTNRVVGLATVLADETVAARLDLPPGLPVTEIRRVRYLDGSPVSFDITYIKTELGQKLAREDLAGRDIFAILEQDYGIPLGHAEQSIQALTADPDLAAWLETAPGAPVLHIERLAHSRDGAPLEFDYVYYRGDTFRYRLHINRV